MSSYQNADNYAFLKGPLPPTPTPTAGCSLSGTCRPPTPALAQRCAALLASATKRGETSPRVGRSKGVGNVPPDRGGRVHLRGPRALRSHGVVAPSTTTLCAAGVACTVRCEAAALLGLIAVSQQDRAAAIAGLRRQSAKAEGSSAPSIFRERMPSRTRGVSVRTCRLRAPALVLAVERRWSGGGSQLLEHAQATWTTPPSAHASPPPPPGSGTGSVAFRRRAVGVGAPLPGAEGLLGWRWRYRQGRRRPGGGLLRVAPRGSGI